MNRPNGYRSRPTARAKPPAAVQPAKSGLLHLLNSPFGLWTLSTVFIGLWSWGYTIWTERRDREREQQEAIRKLDDEIAFRLDTAIEALRRSGEPSTKPAQEAIDSLFGAAKPHYQLYPQYAHRSVISLTYELTTLLEEGSPEQTCVNGALLSLMDIAGLTYAPAESADEGTSGVTINRLKDVMLRRWYNKSAIITWTQYLDEHMGGGPERTSCYEMGIKSAPYRRLPPD